MDFQNTLKELYNSPDVGLLGKTKFKLKVKQLHPEIPNKIIDEFVNKQTLQQVNTSKRQQFKGYYKIVAPPRHYQMDIFFLPTYKRSNNGKYIFMIFVDILSKKMFVYPMDSQNQTEIIKTIEQFVDKHDVKGLASDNQFNIKSVVNFCNEKDISLSTDVAAEDHFSNGNRLGIVDSGVRAIKKFITNYIVANNSTKYIDKLQNLVNNYNTTPHSSISNKTPNSVYDDLNFQAKLQKKLQGKNAELDNDIDLKIGDFVRRAIDRKKFDKANITYSPEIYVIYDIVGNKYVLIDHDENILKRKYKYFELLRVDEKDVDNQNVNDEAMNIDKDRHTKINKIRKDNNNRTYEEVDKDIDTVNNMKTVDRANKSQGTRTIRTTRSGKQS